MDLRALLTEELSKRRQRNRRYSLRAMAKALGIHSSTLTRILNGSRKPTPYLADRILKRLDIDPSTKSSLLLAFHESPVDPKKFEESYKPLAPESVEVLDGWHHFAILSAFEIKGFRPTSAWLAKYFSLPQQQVDSSLDRLARLGLIQWEKGRWKLTGVATTSRKARGRALTKIHREYVERALAVVEKARASDDFSGITMSINKKKLPEAVRRIQEFRRNLAEFLCGSEKELDEVYRLNIQFFSLQGS